MPAQDSTAPTPEESAKAHNLVKALQDKMAKQDTKAGSAMTRKERVEQTYDPDARKTRDLIRRGEHTSLPALVRDLLPFIGDKAERLKLEEALDGFMQASAFYFSTEERPLAVIDWMGGPNGMVSLPPGAQAPEHKQRLADTWHKLLQVVNHLSKVGLLKPPKPLMGEPTAITLLVDLDETAPVATPAAWD